MSGRRGLGPAKPAGDSAPPPLPGKRKAKQKPPPDPPREAVPPPRGAPPPVPLSGGPAVPQKKGARAQTEAPPPLAPKKKRPGVDRAGGAPALPAKRTQQPAAARAAPPPVPGRQAVIETSGSPAAASFSYSNILMDGSASVEDLRRMLLEAEAKLQALDKTTDPPIKAAEITSKASSLSGAPLELILAA